MDPIGLNKVFSIGISKEGKEIFSIENQWMKCLSSSTGRLPLMYNFNIALALYHHDVYRRLRHRMKIIHYSVEKPFSLIKSRQSSYRQFTQFWDLWHQIREEMLNKSFTS